MLRRKQGPKDDIKAFSEVIQAITFAILSVSLTDAKGTNLLAQLATAARSTLEQQELWKRAENFFHREMGCMGRLVKVHGDLQPAASYLILAPGVQLLPYSLLAAKEFMAACASFKSLQLQLQLGRSAVVDHIGKKLNDRLLFCSAYCRGYFACIIKQVC